MPRRPRFTVDNGTYHVMTRGNNRNFIFNYDDDFIRYLDILLENKVRFKFKVYHYVLMDNHTHMIINIQSGKLLAEAMKRINLLYTLYYRRKYKGIGHFFQDRFKSYLIQEGPYLLECGRYIELNPLRAGIVEKPEEYKWSSINVYFKEEKNPLTDLNPEYEGIANNKEMQIKIYRKYIQDGILEMHNEDKYFREGACGSEQFIIKMKEHGLKNTRPYPGRPGKKDKLKNVLDAIPLFSIKQ